MAEPRVIFDRVWKKFRRGERHDSLRDLIPATARKLFASRRTDELGDQEFWALKDVSFEIRAGEVLGIIGSNGAGKSTALKLLTRVLRPTRGQCGVTGRTGALIEVAAGFHPDLTGRENVFLQGAIMGLSQLDIRRKLDAIVEFSGIEPFIDTQVKRYSSGMNARLGFSIAAHLDPEVLLIDEVLAVGDLSFQQKCFERLAEFRSSGIAIAFVSHNMQAVASLCTKALLLRRGLEPYGGSVDQVLARYLAPETAGGESVGVSSISLRGDSREVPDQAYRPGTWLNLSAVLLPKVPLPRATVCLVVERADGLRVFDTSAHVNGLPPADLNPPDAWLFTSRFCANLLTGVYTIRLVVADTDKLWKNVDLGVVASFAVHDTTRWAGVAELYPAFGIGLFSEGAHLGQPPD